MNCKILIGVCSCCSYQAKCQAARETWLSKPQEGIEYVFFIGEGASANTEIDVVKLDIPDTYDALPGKVLAFFRYALEFYDFEHLFKCDDDTYVALDRLTEVERLGYDLVGSCDIARRGAPSGGAGYFLSRSIVEILVRDGSLPMNGAEDLIIGHAALRHNARMRIEYNLGVYPKPFPRGENSRVTAHWLSPDRLRAIHTVNHVQPVEVVLIKHPHWTDTVMLYENGWFVRTQCDDAGRWHRDHAGILRLDWFDWSEEEFVNNGNIRDPETSAVEYRVNVVNFPQ